MYEHVVELVDLFPTMVSLANLPPPPEAYGLEGDNLVPGLISGRVAKRVDAAFSQITRCKDCKEAYAVVADERAGCDADAADMPNFYVPCSQTNRSKFDLMGVSIRTINWRFVEKYPSKYQCIPTPNSGFLGTRCFASGMEKRWYQI